MKNILVPTDFSSNAFHAFRYASELFKNMKCRFFFLNVVSEKKGFKGKNPNGNDIESLLELEDASKIRFERLLSKIKKQADHPKHTYELISKKNELAHVVNLLIHELDIDFIVMGNKGKTSSIPIFLASTATKTIKSVEKCPVLTVPKNYDSYEPKNIGFATDFKTPLHSEAFAMLKNLATGLGASITILHINDGKPLNKKQQTHKEELLSFFDPLACSVHEISNFISKTKVIQVFLEEAHIDMLAMVNNVHGPLEKMMREPIVEKMVTDIKIPYLVLPEMR